MNCQISTRLASFFSCLVADLALHANVDVKQQLKQVEYVKDRLDQLEILVNKHDIKIRDIEIKLLELSQKLLSKNLDDQAIYRLLYEHHNSILE